MAARGLVAFLGGAATKQASILDEQRKLKQTEERERLLIELREQSALRAAEAAEKLQRSRVSATFSGADADEFVYRDAEGRETSRRALTAAEKAARAAAADKEAWDRDYKERELALRGRALDVSAANSRRAAAGRSSSNDTSEGSGTPLDTFTNLLLETYEDDIKDLASKGVPRVEIRAQARQVASAALSNLDTTGEAPSISSIEDHFNNTLRNMYAAIEDKKYSGGATPRSELRSPDTYTHVTGTPGNPTKPASATVRYPAPRE